MVTWNLWKLGPVIFKLSFTASLYMYIIFLKPMVNLSQLHEILVQFITYA